MKSVASRLLTSRIRSAPATNTTSCMPDATAANPALIAEAPEAGPFSTTAAPAGVNASRATAKAMVASERGLASLAQRMTVYAPTPAEIEAFRKAAQPTAKKLIEEKFGPEGATLLAAFLNAIGQARE